MMLPTGGAHSNLAVGYIESTRVLVPFAEHNFVHLDPAAVAQLEFKIRVLLVMYQLPVSYAQGHNNDWMD